MEQTFRIHWLTLTVHEPYKVVKALWKQIFELHLGELVDSGHGAMGFKRVEIAELGARLSSQPAGLPNDGRENDIDYCTISLPGQACDAIPSGVFRQLQACLSDNEYAHNYTRIDLAFDNCPFTPREFFDQVQANNVQSLLKRRTLSWYEQPNELNEVGEIGTSGCSFGSGMSQRMIRVYDKRGYTRLEMQTRADRADLVARSLFTQESGFWAKTAMGHVRDCLDLRTRIDGTYGLLVSFWEKFVDATLRLGERLEKVAEQSIGKTKDWLLHQVAPAFSMVIDSCKDPKEFYNDLVKEGRQRRGPKYEALLRLAAVQA